MQISPHLSFDGRCKEAFEAYQHLLGGELVMLTYGASPLATTVDASWHERIVHATLRLDGFELAGADVRTEDYRKPQGFSVLISVDEREEAERLFSALAVGGEIQFPFQKTFWSLGYGLVTDRFEVPWEISCAQPSASDRR